MQKIITTLAALVLALCVGTAYAQVNPATNIPSGYQPYANGVFYNPSTELYYDPATGNYSSMFSLASSGTPAAPASSTIPGIPNTGSAGGNVVGDIVILVSTALIAIGAGAYALRRQS